MSNSKIKKINRRNSDARKTVGTFMLFLGVIVFICCCFPSFLNIGNFFKGVFGLIIYPLCLLTSLIGLALLMKLKYSVKKKYMFYLSVSLISLICLLHAIFTTNLIYDKLTNFNQMGEYLKICYNLNKGITVGGLLTGIPVYLVRAILGVVGTYAFFGIFATVFVGLTIDYLIYNKKKEKKRENLAKEKAIKTVESDTKIYERDEDLYSFATKKAKKSSELDESFSQDILEFDKEEENFPLFETKDYKTEKMLESETDTIFSFNRDTKKIEETEITESQENAKNLLFGRNDFQSPSQVNAQEEQRMEEKPEEPKSARDILFGNEPKVPNIFDRSSEERDAWRRQYASKPLAFSEENNNEETVSQESQKAEQTQEDFSLNQVEDGLIKTSWGTYRPTASINRNSPIDSISSVNERNIRRDSSLSVNKENESDNQKSEPIFNNNLNERANRIRESRQKTSISNFNRLSESDESTEFSSRLTSQESRINRNGDFLANASSLGIESKKQEEQPSFTSIVENSRKTQEKEPKIKTEPVKVEKISFADQLNKKYNPPPTTILNVVKEEKVDYSQEYKEKSAILERTLSNFKIPAKVINVVRGPKVTRYELSMPSGIPVSKVLSYDKDMSMNLATRSGVRIEAPIPGKNAFGVEVENAKASMVGFRELVESPEFKNFKTPLPVAIGKNISGETIIKDLGKMVHLLVAGSTGSGKSVFLHSLIMSLMYKLSPDELRFIMIDPKRVEFNRYNRMPHLMLPEVVTECSKAINALNWAVKEMERRYDLLMKNDCQKLEQYNNCEAVKNGEEKKLPYLVIVVDELAELMGVAAKEAESKIQRITQLGRASGIHMVIATQRPSVDVVTGVIKNNLPTRVAFSLTSAVDSQTIINQGGAEKLLGQGDMLLMAQDSNQIVRLQAAYVSDDEIKKVLTYIKENNVCVYDEEIQKSIYAEPEKEEPSSDDFASNGSSSNEDRMDELMPQALKLVMKNGKASISMIQRRFSVGYARAARIIDQMETRGYIDGGLGNKPRDIKITIEEYNELFGNFDGE